MDIRKKHIQCKFNQLINQIDLKHPKIEPQLNKLKSAFTEALNQVYSLKCQPDIPPQIQILMGELKNSLKSLSKKDQEDRKLFQCYKSAQKLYSVILNLSKCEKNEKPPAFFQNLHQTSAEMRISMLEEIKSQTSKRNKLEEDYQNLYITMREALLRKEKRIAQLEEQILLLQEKVNEQVHQPSRQLIIENNTLRERIEKLEGDIKLKGEKEKKYFNEIQLLSKKLERERKQNQQNKEGLKALEVKNMVKTQISHSHKASTSQETLSQDKLQQMINQAVEQAYSKELSRNQPESASKGKYKSEIMDNVLEGFSEIPMQRNLTSLQNTFSHNNSDRKVKSAFDSNPKNKEKGEELWRMLFTQAHAIEEFFEEENQNSYQI